MKNQSPFVRRLAGKGSAIVIAILVAFALVVLSYLIWKQPAQPRLPGEPGIDVSPPNASIELSDEQLAQAVQQARIALGHIENERFEEADRMLSEVTVRLPREPFIARNLAICRVMNLESSTKEVDVGRVHEALDSLADVEPESPITNWLTARVAQKLAEKNPATETERQHRTTVKEQLAKACEREPTNVAFWYQTYDALRDGNSELDRQRAVEALDRAHQLAPTNVRILIDWMFEQVSAKNPDVAKSFAAARETLLPLAASVLRRTKADIKEYFAKLEEAVAKQQWLAARSAAQVVRNFLVSEEITRSDGRRVLPNPLEFALYDFSSPTRERLAKLPAVELPAIQVKFQTAWDTAASAQFANARDGKLADVDLDNKSELVVLGTGAVLVFGLQSNGQPGELLMTAAVPEGMNRLLVADLDRDTIVTPGKVKAAEQNAEKSPPFYEADPEVVVFGDAGARILRNDLADDGKTRSLVAVKQDTEFDALRNIVAAALADIDHDGDLDLLLSVDGRLQIWSNRDDLTFEESTRWSQLPPADMRIETMTLADWDRDVDLDVMIGGKDAPSGWLENLRHGQLRWRPFEAEFAELTGAASLAVLEADGNVSWDILAAGKSGVCVALTTTVAPSPAKKLRTTRIDQSPAQQALPLDFDNDGRLDAVVVGDRTTTILRGAADGAFAMAPGVLPDGWKASRIVDIADADGDGDLDLLADNAGRLTLLRNDGGNKNHWLRVRVRGEAEDRSGRVNHFGIGSLLEMRAGSRYQATTMLAQTAHFGLGPNERPDVLRVLFTNGIPQSIVQPQADQVVSEKMINKGSCPYLFAWNGKQMAFVTDLLWAAPLGLQFADGVVAPDRPWEYLKIRGDQLVERDGQFELRLTEELWEAAYFDQVELIAIDHPSDVEIFSNEKVGPAEIAELKIHTVRQRRSPIAARNHRGRDLLSELATADGKMAVAFDRAIRKGRVEDHYLELDLGKLESPRQITLFLTGWIQPGDTSLSVAASHNPDLTPGHPPSLFVPDANGEWIQAIAEAGFPGGKPKTIALDLSNVFPTDDYRVRLATNFELYWDDVFFSADEQPVELRQTTLPLLSAELRYRGFSDVVLSDRSQPEFFDYDRSRAAPQWPPMQGRFTRFGDVRELMMATDARLVVMASGDEMRLQFAAPPSPPTGWKRDFLLRNVGWDKDADLHTIVGQSVEPMPFVGMRSYPYAESNPNDERFQRYIREFQTRETPANRFWRALESEL